MDKKRRGRPLGWPEPWKEFAEKLGGIVALRESMGYASHSTLPAKIAGDSPWSKADMLLLRRLCDEHSFDMARLVP